MRRGFLLSKAPKPKPKPNNSNVQNTQPEILPTTVSSNENALPAGTAPSYLRMVALPRTRTEPQTLTLLLPGGKEAIHAQPGFPAPVIPAPFPPPFALRSVDGKGMGVIATKNLEPGDLIMSERPLVITPQELLFPGSPVAFFDGFLSLLGKEKEFPLYNSLHNCKGPEMSHSLGILNTNAVGVNLPGCPGNYLAVCGTISRLNHSCSPNAEMIWRFESFCEQAVAIRPIRAGEEIVVTYTSLENPRAVRQEELFRKYSFKCACAVCVLPERESRRSDIRRALLDTFSREAIKMEKTMVDAVGDPDFVPEWIRDVQEWVKDASLSDDHIIKTSMRVVEMMDQEGVYPECLGAMHYRILCMAYVALGDRENSIKWARMVVADMIRGSAGDGSAWKKLGDAPQDCPMWGERLQASASQGNSGKGV